MVFRTLALLTAWFVTANIFADTTEIQIDVGDAIMVTVYNEPDLTVKARVTSSGEVFFPLIGAIRVVGKTPAQLSHVLAKAYEDGYLVSPNVSAVIEVYRPFFIRGAVERPGSYAYTFDLTVEQALAVAGGLTDRASQKSWLILRGAAKEPIAATRETKVFPGDVITIEESLF